MSTAHGQPQPPPRGAPQGATHAPLWLHLGGEQVKPGWSIVNIQPGPGVDYVGSVTDLSAFADGTVDKVYASHVYEHLNYRGEIQAALREACRVLKPDGVLMLAVPDLTVLCQLFASANTTPQGRMVLMQIIYGGQKDAFDYHKIGYSLDLLIHFLQEAGFRSIERVAQFNLFDDTSKVSIEGRSISLNVMVYK